MFFIFDFVSLLHLDVVVLVADVVVLLPLLVLVVAVVEEDVGVMVGHDGKDEDVHKHDGREYEKFSCLQNGVLNQLERYFETTVSVA